jgi:hypothetical protein
MTVGQTGKYETKHCGPVAGEGHTRCILGNLEIRCARNGQKFFVSLAGCAPYYATHAIRLGDEPWIALAACLIACMAGSVIATAAWQPVQVQR